MYQLSLSACQLTLLARVHRGLYRGRSSDGLSLVFNAKILTKSNRVTSNWGDRQEDDCQCQPISRCMLETLQDEDSVHTWCGRPTETHVCLFYTNSVISELNWREAHLYYVLLVLYDADLVQSLKGAHFVSSSRCFPCSSLIVFLFMPPPIQ